MNTTENNKLIAEFMGLHKEVFKSGNLNYYIRKLNGGSWYEEHELSYDLSWDWLMPVVDKIKILVMEDDSDELYNSEEWDNITNTLVQIEIKSVYKVVVEFIKEHNN